MMQGSLEHRLRVLRIARGLTLREAAKETGISRETISNIERGISRPHDSTVGKLAQAYGADVWELLEDSASVGKASASDTGRSKKRGEKISIPWINIPRVDTSERFRGRVAYGDGEMIASIPYTPETRAAAFEEAQRVAADARPHYDAVVSEGARLVLSDIDDEEGGRVEVLLEVPLVDSDEAIRFLTGSGE